MQLEDGIQQKASELRTSKSSKTRHRQHRNGQQFTITQSNEVAAYDTNSCAEHSQPFKLKSHSVPQAICHTIDSSYDETTIVTSLIVTSISIIVIDTNSITFTDTEP